MQPREPLGTTEEVAAYLRKTPAALLNLRYLGKAPRAVKIGNRLLWRWVDVENWLEASATADGARST